MKYAYFFIALALLSSCTEHKKSRFNVVWNDTYGSNFKTRAVFEVHSEARKEMEDGNSQKAKELFTLALKDDPQTK
jgi:hypothetical protein